MKSRIAFGSLCAACLFATLLAAQALSQTGLYFGQNKVHYKDFDWAVFRTEHFDVHYYPEEAVAALNAARMAERGYDYLSEVLDHQVRRRIPLVLYASLNDFQQTNVVQGILGDGTRGVTEGLKNRVVLPITGSYRDFNHVLVHELVHAFQFDMLTNGGGGGGLGGVNMPLWFVEGMAEALSVGMDNITRMWVRDGLLNDDLLSVAQLNSTFDIRVYRLGEAVWYFVGQTYGEKKIGQIFKTAVTLRDVEQAFVAQTGMDFDKLTRAWHESMRALVLPAGDSLQRTDQVAQQLTRHESFFHRMNVVPSVSPDGKKIAYVANKNLVDELYLLTERQDGEFEDRRLVKGGQSRGFESLRFFETSISWSPDGNWIAFVSKSGKDDAIYIMDPLSKEVQHRLVFDKLNGLVSPAFSPDGNRLVFVGISGGISDLYTVRLDGSGLERLTDDPYAELQPQWSPDGSRIAFVTDRGPGTHLDQLLFSDYDLALYSLSTGRIDLITSLNGNAINPRWVADGRTIAFVSDHQGIPNVYELDLTSQEIRPLTSLLTGVAGITQSTPAMSLSADGSLLAFSSFWKGGWQVFRTRLPEEPAETNGVHAASDSSWLPAVPEPNDFYAEYSLAHVDSVEERDYGSKLSLEAAAVGASIGGLYGSVGGAQFLFGDLLGNQSLIISSALQFDLTSPDVGVAYLNQARRLNFGISGFQAHSRYGAFLGANSLGLVEETYRGLSVFGLYPFSRFTRVELSAGVNSVGQKLTIETFSSGGVTRESRNLDRLTFGELSAAVVFDKAVYGPIGPMGGSRSRFSLFQTTHDYQSTTFVGDYRRYLKVSSRSAIAYRLLGGASKGRNAQIFSVGGPYTFRGSDFGEVFGTDFFVQNLEYRFPLFPFAPPSADFFTAVAFLDAAAAWGIDVPGLAKESFQPFSNDGGFHLQDLKAAFGVGARLNLGYFALRYDLGWPTDLRNVGHVVQLFSIGVDY